MTQLAASEATRCLAPPRGRQVVCALVLVSTLAGWATARAAAPVDGSAAQPAVRVGMGDTRFQLSVGVNPLVDTEMWIDDADHDVVLERGLFLRLSADYRVGRYVSMGFSYQLGLSPLDLRYDTPSVQIHSLGSTIKLLVPLLDDRIEIRPGVGLALNILRVPIIWSGSPHDLTTYVGLNPHAFIEVACAVAEGWSVVVEAGLITNLARDIIWSPLSHATVGIEYGI